MTDELASRVRFRLERSAHNWIIRRTYVSKNSAEKLPTEKWKHDSYHPNFKRAAVFMLERLIQEGYQPRGLDALVKRIEDAERRILAWCEELQTNKDAELEG